MPHAGLLAPKEDKVFVEGVRRFIRGDHAGALAQFQDASARDATGRYVGEELFEAMCLVELGRMAEAIAPLETVVRSDAAIPDARMIRYHIEGGFEIQITPFTSARVPMSHLTAALMLAEVYQHAERTEDAIRLLESLGATSSDRLFALSLAELYDGASRWNDVVRVTDEFTENTDDVGLQLVLYRANALGKLGMSDGALAMCKEALRFRKREPQLLHVARYLRARSTSSRASAR